MKFILDEAAYVNELIETKSLGKSYRISIRLLLKYLQNQGMEKDEAIRFVRSFILDCLPSSKWSEWETLTGRLADLVYENPLPMVKVERVVIDSEELETILSAPTFDEQKVLYCLLVYKKVQNQMSSQTNDWFTGSLGEIFQMARITGKKANVVSQCELINRLKEAGYLDLAKSIKNLNLKLNYLHHEPKDEAMVITHFEDVIHDFYAYLGHRVVRCQYCGKMIKLKKKERASKRYCPVCVKIRNHDRVKEHRLRQKIDQNVEM